MQNRFLVDRGRRQAFPLTLMRGKRRVGVSARVAKKWRSCWLLKFKSAIIKRGLLFTIFPTYIWRRIHCFHYRHYTRQRIFPPEFFFKMGKYIRLPTRYRRCVHRIVNRAQQTASNVKNATLPRLTFELDYPEPPISSYSLSLPISVRLPSQIIDHVALRIRTNESAPPATVRLLYSPLLIITAIFTIYRRFEGIKGGREGEQVTWKKSSRDRLETVGKSGGESPSRWIGGSSQLCLSILSIGAITEFEDR